MNSFKLLKYKVIKGKIITLTGLHIGAGNEEIKIGGIDNPVIRHPLTNEPFIPGSSLKGKMRSLLELALGKIDVKKSKIHEQCDDEKCPICRIFGVGAKEGSKTGPTRILVRDAFIHPEYKKKMKEQGWTNFDLSEEKKENNIDRITAAATPRTMERVPAGTEFELEIYYRVFDVDGDGGTTDNKMFEYVEKGLKLIEKDSLGGYGSRGSGKVKFEYQTSEEIAVE